MKTLAMCLAAGLSVIGCAQDHVCDPNPSGLYAIDFKRAVFSCTQAQYKQLPKDVFVAAQETGEGFSKDGCELSIRGSACDNGPGLCGNLHWTGPGVYEGTLTYAHPVDNGSGAWADCVIHSEEAVLTFIKH